jgi:hypothetical protein
LFPVGLINLLDEVCGIENLSKESLINMLKEIEKDYLETIEKEPKIEKVGHQNILI